ncbi:MAG: hydantoinase B/oxoprolinase family protein, partial [Alphaproteobacteria bacterium]|nr:hydantoinase B/oxoprolinase family protein [Alphaproteobacteria bacterium]
ESNLYRGNEKIKLHSKDMKDLRKGDVLSFRLSGAGGYGTPEERERAAIERDLADGYVSVEAVARDYGYL